MQLLPSVLRPVSFTALGVCLVGLLGCGGSSSVKPTSSATPSGVASTLVYTAPTGDGYQLVRDASSTGTHLVLDLVGPVGAEIKGVEFSLGADATKATWGSAGGVDPYLKEGEVLSLGTGTKLMKSKLSGSVLQAALFQKGSVAAATLGHLPILSVALDLKAGASAGAVSLTSATAQILDGSGKTQGITLALGNLTAE